MGKTLLRVLLYPQEQRAFIPISDMNNLSLRKTAALGPLSHFLVGQAFQPDAADSFCLKSGWKA